MKNLHSAQVGANTLPGNCAQAGSLGARKTPATNDILLMLLF
jgi:hypothetical protein